MVVPGRGAREASQVQHDLVTPHEATLGRDVSNLPILTHVNHRIHPSIRDQPTPCTLLAEFFFSLLFSLENPRSDFEVDVFCIERCIMGGYPMAGENIGTLWISAI